MSVADRTYSFRAPSGFGDRVLAAQREHARLALDPHHAHHISREIETALLRRNQNAAGVAPASIMRSVVEAFVDAVERAVEDEDVASGLREFDRADLDGPEERVAFLGSSAALDSE